MKVWAWVVLAGLVFASAAAGSRFSYVAGYDKRDQEVQQDILDAQEAARKEAEEMWRETVAAAEAEIIIEERIVEKIRVVEKDIPRVVERIVEITPECADLGPDFAGVLNDQIRASNSVPDTELASDVAN